jgi:hypothetical protein
MASSGMLRRVTLVRNRRFRGTYRSILRVTRIGVLVTANVRSLPILVTLMMDALSYSETSDLKRATRRNIPEDAVLHSHRRENLKSYIFINIICQQFTNEALS